MSSKSTKQAKSVGVETALAVPKAPIAVVVTTKHRDVWFGHTLDPQAEVVTLTGARHCYQWDTREGIGELASKGPGDAARIGAVVPVLDLRDVVCVLHCTVAARARFEAARWMR